MQIYLVGGAVRDTLLGLPVKDRDFVVVGARPQDLLDQGFKQVGHDFPVFLHPVTHEEYALARTEKKSGSGYTGFNCSFGPEVTLEEDLKRRDLTINAIAQDESGQLHDPYGGIKDLQERTLRHISPAFCEDPLRVLRAARFAARLAPLGFTLHPDTHELLRRMAASGELCALTPERVYMEVQKALAVPAPALFFTLLPDCGALAQVLPPVAALFADGRWRRVEQAFNAAAKADLAVPQRLALLTAALNDAEFKKLQDLLPLTREERDLTCILRKGAADAAMLPDLICRGDPLKAGEFLQQLFTRLDLYRRGQRLKPWLQCAAVWEPDAAPLLETLQDLYQRSAAVQAKTFAAQGLKGAAIGQAQAAARVQLLSDAVGKIQKRTAQEHAVNYKDRHA